MTSRRNRQRLVIIAARGTLLLACCPSLSPFLLVRADAQQPVAIPACEVYEIAGPTVIAFLDYANGRTQPGFNDALADFQWFLRRLHERLDQSVIRVQECYQPSFEIRLAGKQQYFKVGKEGVGYYLVAPGTDPRVEHEIVTDNDLIEIMEKYFGKQIVDRALRCSR
jgi:hypothetical protein